MIKSEEDFPPSRGDPNRVSPRQRMCTLCKKESRRLVQKNCDKRRKGRYSRDPVYREVVLKAGKKYRDTHREQLRDKYRQRRRVKKDSIFDWYGGKCECCGEATKEFLTIDHVNNDGAEHRRRVGPAGVIPELYRAGKRLPGFQLLCYNCNCAKQFSGRCPHQGPP